MAHTAMSGSGTTAGDDPLQTAVWRLRSRACWTDAAALLEPRTPPTGRGAPAGVAARRAVPVHRAGLGRGGGRAAHRRGPGPRRRRARAPRPVSAGQLAYASTLLGVRDRADEARAALGRAAALLAPGAPGRAAAGLPARPDRREPRRLAAVRPRRLPPRPRRRHRARRHAAALLHLAPSRRTRPARGRVGGGPARVRRVAADPGGAGLSGRHGPGARRPWRTPRPEPEAAPAARGGGPAVPPPGRRPDLAGPRTCDPPEPRSPARGAELTARADRPAA